MKVQAPKRTRRLDNKARRQNSRVLVPIDQTSGPARFYSRLVKDIENDLAPEGRRELSRIQAEMVRAFAGGATMLQYLNHQILLGDGSAIDLAGFANISNTLLRIGAKLGFARRAKQIPDLDTFLHERAKRHAREQADAVEIEADAGGLSP